MVARILASVLVAGALVLGWAGYQTVAGPTSASAAAVCASSSTTGCRAYLYVQAAPLFAGALLLCVAAIPLAILGIPGPR